jgi:hypothetical protein
LCIQLYSNTAYLHKHNMGIRNQRGRVLNGMGQLLVDAHAFACYDLGHQLLST